MGTPHSYQTEDTRTVSLVYRVYTSKLHPQCNTMNLCIPPCFYSHLKQVRAATSFFITHTVVASTLIFLYNKQNKQLRHFVLCRLSLPSCVERKECCSYKIVFRCKIVFYLDQNEIEFVLGLLSV